MSQASPIRIVIAEDQQLIRRAFASLLSLEPDIEVVAMAADGAEALDLCRRHRPDVIIMDIQMPRLDGIAATRKILAELPETRIIVLTTFDSDDLVLGSIAAGAAAYLLKDATETEIIETIRCVVRGEARLSPNLTRKLFDQLRRTHVPLPAADEQEVVALTKREEAILELLARGSSNKQIADTIFLAEGTVKNYVSRIMEKLGAQSRTELAVRAMQRPRR